MNETKQIRKPMKTRCYYTDYVNHMIRFYLTCPDSVQTEGKRKADILNWMAVQAVFYHLTDDKKQVLKEIYAADHNLVKGVRIYCKKTGADLVKTWVFITNISKSVAKKRGLI